MSLEQYSDNLDSMAGVAFYGGILCRGFVNAHCHSELSYLRGAIAQGGGYSAFAAAMAQVRGNYTDTERTEALINADQAMWNEGIDAVADIVNDHSSFAVKSQSKICYRSFAEVFGLKKSNLSLCQELTQEHNCTLTPHSTYSIQQRDMEVLNYSHNSLITIHFKESEQEEQLYAGYGPLAEWYRSVGFECDFLGFGSPAERIVATIPSHQPLMLVHNCCVTQRDIDLIMGHFTAPVYWTLCPRSNRYISSAVPNVVELLRANKLNICIGTDSLASNSSLSILEELKCFESIPLAERLIWATTNGAEALRVANRGWVNIVGVDLERMQLTEKSLAKRVL